MTSVAEPGAPLRPRRDRRRAGRRVSVVGVLGELLITAGVLVLLFLGWQLWLNDIIVGQQLRGESEQLSQVWGDDPADLPPLVAPEDPADTTAPPVREPSANAEQFALLIVPRWGADYYRPIAEGVGARDVLNRNQLGRYPTTQMPGQVGNFAIAAHRKAYGGNLEHIHELQVGDAIWVETPDGWYEYRFRNLEYVQPTGVGVIDPVPQQTEFAPGDRLITLTSCNPFFSTAERIIAYGVYEGFTPRADGAPESIAPTVQGAG